MQHRKAITLIMWTFFNVWLRPWGTGRGRVGERQTDRQSFGVGAVFFVITLLFDILVARRGFCRYLCPGGALYSLLGRYRLLRIRRDVKTCNDCVKCNAICEFGLNPMRDDFGQECNNCTACIAVCPTDALRFTAALHDDPDQGAGHLSPHYRRKQANKGEQ